MSGQVILYFDDQADALRFALAAGSVMAGDGSRTTGDLVQEAARVTRIRTRRRQGGESQAAQSSRTRRLIARTNCVTWTRSKRTRRRPVRKTSAASQIPGIELSRNQPDDWAVLLRKSKSGGRGRPPAPPSRPILRIYNVISYANR